MPDMSIVSISFSNLFHLILDYWEPIQENGLLQNPRPKPSIANSAWICRAAYIMGEGPQGYVSMSRGSEESLVP